ncbi:MAG TPA: ABC transporter substrate-binding protein [Alphaproteobacteria bacterium]|nr:ABC transporter substrate-binding protein [Alphaproteobacteria bacterium]HNS43669.1 ABC transporter substrate-binding protein [Alphaproteobacteria bacterium]
MNYALNKNFSLVAVCALMVGAFGVKAHAAVPVSEEGISPLSLEQISVSEDDSKAALDFVKSTAERGLTFLSNPESTQEQKKKEFRKLLDSSFDLETIARFALGKYWNAATLAQQKEYVTLFKKMVVQVYADRFGEYKGQKFEVKSARPVGSKDAMVASQIVPADGGENILVDWRVRKNGSAYKIVDVYVAGVSMSVTQRSDFSSVIQRGGGDVAVLIDYLKAKF